MGAIQWWKTSVSCLFLFYGCYLENKCLSVACVQAQLITEKIWKVMSCLCFYVYQVKGWTSEASDEMRRLLGSEAVEMQVFGEDGDTLLVDMRKTAMVSLREHLVFMELARCVIVTSRTVNFILRAH